MQQGHIGGLRVWLWDHGVRQNSEVSLLLDCAPFTLLFGIVTGYYYVRERNLIPLMITHAMVDLWSFGWFLFLR